MNDVPSGGALASAISSLRMACSAMEPSRAADVFRPGESDPALLAHLRQPVGEEIAVALLRGRQIRFDERANLVAKRLFLRSKIRNPLQASQRGDAFVVVVGIAEHRPRPFRSFQKQLNVVFGGEADGAVQLHAVDADARERIAGVRLRQRRRAGEFDRRVVHGPRGVVRTAT